MPLASSIRNAGCARFSTNVTALSPFATTSSRLRYQALRGLSRNFSGDLPVSRSQVHLISAAVKGLPSCHLTPCRSLKVSLVVLVPRPALGQFRLDELGPILLLVLLEQHEVVEDAHHRRDRRDRRLLVDRHARRAVTVKEFEDPAGLLRRREAHGQPKDSENRQRQ